MEYINRKILNDIKDQLKYFPILLIRGARQTDNIIDIFNDNLEKYVLKDMIILKF